MADVVFVGNFWSCVQGHPVHGSFFGRDSMTRRKRPIAVHFRIPAETMAEVIILTDHLKLLRSEVLRQALQVGLKTMHTQVLNDALDDLKTEALSA